jgi:hypothetical protein
MCNTYVIRPKRGAQSLAQRVGEATAKLASELVRKSDPGVVVRADGRVEVMRWGFHREFNPAINNARSDKLEGGMWQEAFHERRCVIPMAPPLKKRCRPPPRRHRRAYGSENKDAAPGEPENRVIHAGRPRRTAAGITKLRAPCP